MAMSFDPLSELDRLASGLLQSRPGPRVMQVDLYREADRYILTADLPGVCQRRLKTDPFSSAKVDPLVSCF